MPETSSRASTADPSRSAAKTTYRSVLRVVRVAALILLLPLLAMQFTDEVAWGAVDFAVAGVLLIGTGLAYVLITRKAGSVAYRVAAGVALAAALLLVWVHLAVGILGSQGLPANLMVLGVVAVGILGALVARFQPRGMAHALFATALTQALAAGIAAVARWGSPDSSTAQILALNGFFVALFVASALLFRRAAEPTA